MEIRHTAFILVIGRKKKLCPTFLAFVNHNKRENKITHAAKSADILFRFCHYIQFVELKAIMQPVKMIFIPVFKQLLCFIELIIYWLSYTRL